MADEGEDLRIEGDAPLDWLRHVLGTVAVLLFPAWVMATALFAQADGLRFTVVVINGEPALVEVSSLWRFALAGAGAAAVLVVLLAGALLAVWVFMVLRSRVRGAGAVAMVDADLPAGTAWSVRVRRDGEGAPRAQVEADAPAPKDAPPTVAPVGPESPEAAPSSVVVRQDAPPSPAAAPPSTLDPQPRRVDADDEVDALFASDEGPPTPREG